MRNEPTILFVEDDPTVRFASTQALELAGRQVRSFASAELVMDHIEPGFPGVLLTDVRLPGIDGLALLERARQIVPDLPVILVTGHGDITMAVEAMRMGAYDFIEKPFSADRLNDVITRALTVRRLSLEVSALRAELNARSRIDARLIGRSASMAGVRRVILNIAPTDADVLIVGETGAGKELVARCLHDYSGRKTRNFVAVACGGTPAAIFDSEMFGHQEGAFVGATHPRIGKLEHASGGTIFLDEIESMTDELQVKLLRVLQERQFERLGSNEVQPMTSRVIAAIQTDSATGNLRNDLYYRLSVVVLKIPPLRERREDIPSLLGHFLLQASYRYERPVPELSADRMNRLMAHAWPGNVRELRNVADRLALGMPTGLEVDGDAPAVPRALDEQMALFERQLIEEALSRSNGRAAAAAELLGVPKKTLYDKMKRLGITNDQNRGGPATESV